MTLRNLLALAVTTAAIIFSSSALADSEYVRLDKNVAELRDAFNADKGKLRVFMYVSPTCGGCLRGAKLTNNDVLAEIDNLNLAAYVVWVPKNGAREKHVDRALSLVTDQRATQYWDEFGILVNHYDTMYGIEGRPCAGVFMLYAPDAEWGAGGPPKPAYFEDAHAREFRRTAGSQFDAQQLAEQARRILREQT